MENTELITALRWCGDEKNEWCVRETYKCPLWNEDRITDECKADLMLAAADALEAKSKAVIPHRNYENLNLYWCDCGWFLRNRDKTPNYCPNCGKRIEWENAE